MFGFVRRCAHKNKDVITVNGITGPGLPAINDVVVAFFYCFGRQAGQV